MSDVLARVAVAAFVIVLLAGLLAVGMGVAELVYGDWRCAFAECRIVK